MSKYEKLILLLIALVLLEKFSGFSRDMYLAYTYGALIPPDVELYWENISVVFGLFVNFGSAVWVFIEVKAISSRAWIWSLLGLFFGLIGIVVFYAIQLYATKRKNET